MGIISLARRAGKIESGDEAVRRTIHSQKACLIIIANDAAKRTKDNFAQLAKDADIPMIIYSDKESLGEILGREVRAVLAITSDSFKRGIVQAFERGEFFDK